MARKVEPVQGVEEYITKGGARLWRVRMKPYPLAKKAKRFGSFKTIYDANRKAEEIRQKIEHGDLGGVQGMGRKRGRLLSELIADFLEKTKGRPSYVADRGYGKWWAAHYHDIRDVDVTPELLQEAIDTLQEDERELADQTIFHHMKFLRHILNIEVDSNRLLYNPFRHPEVQEAMPKPCAGPAQYYKDAEEAALRAALGPVRAKWFRFAIVTGLRYTEQFSLEWPLVDLPNGVALLRSTKRSKLKGEKNGLEAVMLNDEAVAILRTFDSWQYSKWVFPSKNPATYLSKRNFYRDIWVPATKAANLVGAKWHTCRHTFASRLAMSGKSELEIASALRHSSTELVKKRYAHLMLGHMRAMLNELSTYKDKI